jgi:amidase
MTRDERTAYSGGFFVPHDLKAPIKGARAGPLAGLVAAVKDMYDITGERTGGGSPEWLAMQKPAPVHAAAVKDLVDAGATIIGKTICDELFFSVTGQNFHYGTPANPRAFGRLPGGSSSGSAAATAAGCCDFALGSDTGGSVRVPAAFCGVYGIRTTHGRVDLLGAMPMAPSFDTGGWFANGPGVFRRVGDVLLKSARVDAPIHNLIVADDAFAEADPEVIAVLRDALARMGKALPKPIRTRVAPEGLDPWREAFRIIQGREIWEIYGNFVEQHKPNLGPGIKQRMAFAATVNASSAGTARATQRAARDQMRALLKPGSVLALPTAPGIAPFADTPAKKLESFRLRVMRLTCIAGLAGLPQVTMPVGSASGCPVGLSFIGWPGADEALLDFAMSLSRYCNAG